MNQHNKTNEQYEHFVSIFDQDPQLNMNIRQRDDLKNTMLQFKQQGFSKSDLTNDKYDKNTSDIGLREDSIKDLKLSNQSSITVTFDKRISNITDNSRNTKSAKGGNIRNSFANQLDSKPIKPNIQVNNLFGEDQDQDEKRYYKQETETSLNGDQSYECTSPNQSMIHSFQESSNTADINQLNVKNLMFKSNSIITEVSECEHNDDEVDQYRNKNYINLENSFGYGERENGIMVNDEYKKNYKNINDFNNNYSTIDNDNYNEIDEENDITEEILNNKDYNDLLNNQDIADEIEKNLNNPNIKINNQNSIFETNIDPKQSITNRTSSLTSSSQNTDEDENDNDEINDSKYDLRTDFKNLSVSEKRESKIRNFRKRRSKIDENVLKRNRSAVTSICNSSNYKYYLRKLQNPESIELEDIKQDRDGMIVVTRSKIKQEFIKFIRESFHSSESIIDKIENDIKSNLILIVRPGQVNFVRSELFRIYNLRIPDINNSTVNIEDETNEADKVSNVQYKKLVQYCKHGDVIYDLFALDNQGDVEDIFEDFQTHNQINMFVKDKRRRNQNFLILKSDDIFKLWSLVILTVITFLMLQLPFQFSEPNLGDQVIVKVVDNIIMSIFLVDIIINFCTATETSDGKKIYDHDVIALNQMKSWFLIDLVSTIEVNWIFMFVDQPEDSSGVSNFNSNFIKLFKLKFTHIFKVMRSAKLLRVLRHLETIGGPVRFFMEQKSTSILLKSGLILLFCHFLSCIQVWIYRETQHSYNWQNHQLESNGRVPEDYGNSFLQLLAWQMSVQTVTTVGYGDIPATNTQELICRCIAMIMGTYLWSFVSASIISWTVDETMNDFEQKKYHELTQNIIKKQNIDYEGIDRIGKSLLVVKDTELKEEQNQLTNKMPQNDTQQVLHQIYTWQITNVKFFETKTYDFFITIYPFLKLVMFETDTYLDQNKYTDDPLELPVQLVDTKKLYILQTGEIGTQDYILEKYNIVPQGIIDMIEPGQVINLDKIIQKNFYTFDKDYIVFENSEIIEIDYQFYETTLMDFQRSDMGQINQETIDTGRNLFTTYLLNKQCIWYTLILLKFRGAYIKEIDLSSLRKKLDINEQFFNSMYLKIKREPPVNQNNVENWQSHQMDQESLKDIKKHVLKKIRDIDEKLKVDLNENNQRKAIVENQLKKNIFGKVKGNQSINSSSKNKNKQNF